ncbi:MAG: HU family DNA-binding protein [Planctomycetes bacterium]|nr:HU family DNA-binding protein [Planctomycetota bacterium]
MNKQQLIQWIHESNELGTNSTKAAAERALNAVLHGITEGLKKSDGHQVSLVGFGSFTVKERPGRMGRNPRTGEPIKIKKSKSVGFRPGKALKDSVSRVKLG